VYVPDTIAGNSATVTTIRFGFYDFADPTTPPEANYFQGTKLFRSQTSHSRYFGWQMNHPLAPLSDMLVQQLFIGSDAFQRKDYYQNLITVCWCGNFNSSSTAEIDVPKLQRIELTYSQR